MGEVVITSELPPEKIAWSDWGIYSYSQFTQAFLTSPELMRIQIEGRVDTVLEDMVAATEDRFPAAVDFIGAAAVEFAKRMVPHRTEIIGKASVYNPYRDSRPGAGSSIPTRAPDVYQPILSGDIAKGHAIVTSFDQDTATPVDDVFAQRAFSRTLGNADAHAVTIVNRFPAYVRVMDEKLERLLRNIGFETPQHLKPSLLTSIPFGANFVTFPFEYHESHSTMPMFTLYATMKSAQRGLKRTLSTAESQFHDVFFNIQPLAGGTIPRIHMQTYIKTRGHPQERYERPAEAQVSSRDFDERDIARLGVENRSWFAYVPWVKGGKYDLRIESKREKEKDFSEYDAIELWDLAEMLVYLSKSMDKTLTYKDLNTGKDKVIDERNIVFFPKGIVLSPFAVEGGHEVGVNEKIYGRSPFTYARQFTENGVTLPRNEMYRIPADSRGEQEFRRLVDESSPIYRMSA